MSSTTNFSEGEERCFRDKIFMRIYFFCFTLADGVNSLFNIFYIFISSRVSSRRITHIYTNARTVDIRVQNSLREQRMTKYDTTVLKFLRTETWLFLYFHQSSRLARCFSPILKYHQQREEFFFLFVLAFFIFCFSHCLTLRALDSCKRAK